jgi:hypothetical protein
MAIDEKFKVFINSLHGKARNLILQALTVVTAYSVTPFAARLGPGWIFNQSAASSFGNDQSQAVPWSLRIQ